MSGLLLHPSRSSSLDDKALALIMYRKYTNNMPIQVSHVHKKQSQMKPLFFIVLPSPSRGSHTISDYQSILLGQPVEREPATACRVLICQVIICWH